MNQVRKKLTTMRTQEAKRKRGVAPAASGDLYVEDSRATSLAFAPAPKKAPERRPGFFSAEESATLVALCLSLPDQSILVRGNHVQ